MMRDMTADAVKRAAIRIMMMPTGILVFSPVSAEIQPLHTHTHRHRQNESLYHIVYDETM